MGTFFFDLPSAEERKAIWNIYLTKWNRTADLPDDEGWTGAEIKECARKAWRLKMSLKESAGYIVPVSRSAADQIEEWQGAGLNVPSGVKAQLANVEERLLVKIIGSLTAVDRQSLDEKLRTWLLNSYLIRQPLNYLDADLRTVRRRDRPVLIEHHFPIGTRPSSRYLRLRSNSQPHISPSPSRLISTIRPPMQ